MRQVSEEATGIFDFIIVLYNHCSGDWAQLGKEARVENIDLQRFLTRSAMFLSNVGNYYVLSST
jgi:dipeptidyl-peptidase III